MTALAAALGQAFKEPARFRPDWSRAFPVECSRKRSGRCDQGKCLGPWPKAGGLEHSGLALGRNRQRACCIPAKADPRVPCRKRHSGGLARLALRGSPVCGFRSPSAPRAASQQPRWGRQGRVEPGRRECRSSWRRYRPAYYHRRSGRCPLSGRKRQNTCSGTCRPRCSPGRSHGAPRHCFR